MLLFCAPFALVGVFMGFLIAQIFTDSMAMSNWAERPATVLQAGGSSNKATVEFLYDYQGTAYQSTKLRRRNGSSDNIGPFHKNWRKRLLRLQKNGDSIPCYVNPDKPDEAVLYRGIRWEMVAFKSVFLSVFGGFGFLMPLFALRQSKRADYKIEQAGLASEWVTAEPMWPNPVRVSMAARLFGPLIVGFIFTAVTVPFIVISALEHKFLLALLGVPFLLVVVGAIAVFLRGLGQFRRFGGSTLDMRTRPALPGSLFEANLELHGLPPDTPLKVTLESCHETNSDDSSHRRILWRSMREFVEADLERRGAAVLVPIGFALPENARTCTVREGVGIHWKLRVQAKLPGPDLELSFPVPVYPPGPPHTGEKIPRTEFLPGRHLTTTGEAVDDLADALSAQGIHHETLYDGGFNITVPPLRQIGLHMGGLIFYAVLLGGGIFMVFKGYRFGHVLGAIATISALWSVRSMFRQHRIEAVPDGLLVHHTVFGFGRERWFPWSEIVRFRSKSNTKVNDTRLYDVLMYTPAKTKILRWLEGKEVSETLAKELEKMREAAEK